jgi:L-rhamnose mutarotase
MKRYGSVLGLSEEGKAEYKALHAAVWPAVLAKISDCHIRNYSIFLKEPENLLFSYFEYHGEDFAADMARMAADPETQAWWAVNMPLQRPLDTRKDGEWWADMEEIFHHD